MDGRVKEIILNAPDSPGVYVFKRKGKPIYVGKAKDLSRRLRSYLRPDDDRIASMVSEADELELIPTTTEEGALVLEANLIRRHRPRYNVRLKDGNPFLYIHLTDEEFPRITVVRTPKDGGENYGPFLRRKTLREFMRFARRLFPIRNCSLKLPSRKRIPPCVEYHIGRCLAPCAYDVGEEYRTAVDGLRKLLRGDSEGVRRLLYERMMEEARRYNYEAANNTDLPVEIITRPGIDLKTLSGVRVREPTPEEEEVVKVASDYAYSKLESVLMARERTNPALSSLQKVLRLPEPPTRIEGYDISHTFGENRVASMVVFKDGKPFKSGYRRFKIRTFPGIKSGYRRFKIRTFPGIDDYAAMYEVVNRRFRRLKEEGGETPNLVLIDGGIGQLRAALKAMRDAGIEVPAVALAKRYETLYLPSGEVVQLPVNDPALRLLMRVRDEAHRFALKYHRTLRSKKYGKSVLEEIPGIGKKRKKILLSHFGSVERIRMASVQEIASLPTFNVNLAKRVKEYLKGES